jgi:hypothetical protein
MKYIIIDGVKYQLDPNDNTKALLDDKGEKVPYVEPQETEEEKKEREEKEKKEAEGKTDLSKVSLEDLKKANPEVAKLFSSVGDMQAKLDKLAKDEEDKGRNKKKEEGKFQELFEEAETKRKEAEGRATKADEILGKYKSTVNGVLEETLKSIPAERHSLIPADFSARKKLEYINTNAKVLGVVVGGKGSPIPKNDDDINLDEESKTQKEYDELLKKGKDRTPLENKKVVELARKIKEIREANANKK